MAITLTDKAAAHVNRNLQKRGKGCGLRLGVRTTGQTPTGHYSLNPQTHLGFESPVVVRTPPHILTHIF